MAHKSHGPILLVVIILAPALIAGGVAVETKIDGALADARDARAELAARAEHERSQQAQLAALQRAIAKTETEVRQGGDKLRALSNSDENLNAQLQATGQVIGDLRAQLGRLAQNIGKSPDGGIPELLPPIDAGIADENPRGEAAALVERLRPFAQGAGALVLLRGDAAVIRIQADRIFYSGEPWFRPGGRELLIELAGVLAGAGWHGPLQIAVHSDETRGASPSLWSSTAAQAAQVVDVVESSGLRSGVASAAGYGASDPLGSNATAEGRVANRRVEIILRPAFSDNCGSGAVDVRRED